MAKIIYEYLLPGHVVILNYLKYMYVTTSLFGVLRQILYVLYLLNVILTYGTEIAIYTVLECSCSRYWKINVNR